MQRCALLALALGACRATGPGGGGEEGSTGAATTTMLDTTTGAMSTGDASTGPADPTTGGSGEESGSSGSTGGDPTPMYQPLCEGGLPYAIDRTPAGDPVDAADLTAITQQYLDLLTYLRYFDLVAERAHGWPENDPRGRYWWETWWSGADIVKEGGEITFLHNESGGDNNGLRTGPFLEGVCYALALWDRPEDEHLVRGFMRGFIAWMRAMERSADDPDAPMLSRAFYPESVEDDLGFMIDYSLNRPGVDADPSEYVHVPENPYWGDIWIKNKRSKDDLGHMLRAIAQLSTCEAVLGPDGLEEFDELRTLYSSWARKVEDDGWHIATLDKDGEFWLPDDLLAYFVLQGNAECDAVLSLRLLGRGDPGDLDCGNGIGMLDPFIIGSNDHNGNILRSFHEAAANNALITGNDVEAEALSEGLWVRLEEALDGHEGITDPVPFLTPEDTVDMLTHAMAVGVPLTWREIRYLHDRIAEAATSYPSAANDDILNVFDASVPDGTYAFRPYGSGIDLKALGSLLAACASPCVDPASNPVVDCDLINTWSP